jgi:ASC-1-like (ASCH) protein
MQHIERLSTASIDDILEGKKKAEVIFMKERKPPMECVTESDEIYFQSKDGFAVAKANVTCVKEFDDLTPESALEMLETHQDAILPTVLNKERDIYFKYAMLFYFDNVQEIKPFFIEDNGNGWIQTTDIDEMINSGRLTLR